MLSDERPFLRASKPFITFTSKIQERDCCYNKCFSLLPFSSGRRSCKLAGVTYGDNLLYSKVIYLVLKNFYKELDSSINYYVDNILYLDVIFFILISFYKICPSNIFYKEMIIKFLNSFKKSMVISGITGRRYLSEAKECEEVFKALLNFSN